MRSSEEISTFPTSPLESQQSAVQGMSRKSKMVLFFSLAVVGLVLLGSFTALCFMNSDSQLETKNTSLGNQNLSSSEISSSDSFKGPTEKQDPVIPNYLTIFGRTFQKPPAAYIVICAVLLVLVLAGASALIAYNVYSAQQLHQQELELLKQQQQEAAARAIAAPEPFNFFNQLFFKSSALPKFLIAFTLLCQVALLALPLLVSTYGSNAFKTKFFKFDHIPLFEVLLISSLLTGLWQLGAFANLSVALFFQTPATYWLIAAASAWIFGRFGPKLMDFCPLEHGNAQDRLAAIFAAVRLLIVPLTVGGLCAIGGFGAFVGVMALAFINILMGFRYRFYFRAYFKGFHTILLILSTALYVAVPLYLIIGSLVLSQITIAVPFSLFLVGAIIFWYLYDSVDKDMRARVRLT